VVLQEPISTEVIVGKPSPSQLIKKSSPDDLTNTSPSSTTTGVTLLAKPIPDGVRKQTSETESISREIPIVTEAQKYIDHDSVIPKVIPPASASEII